MPKQPNNLIKKVYGMKYVGSGFGFIMGVPTRDLTTDEWMNLFPEQQQQVLGSKLYEPITIPGPAPVEQVAGGSLKEQI